MAAIMKVISKMTSTKEKVFYKKAHNNLLGVAYFSDGCKYDGEWKEDKYHGNGLLVFPDGRKYEGGFCEGRFSGKGIALYKLSRAYYI